PLVNSILAIVALPIRNAGASHGGAKALGLSHCPHGHVTAITPAADADPILIYRCYTEHLVHAGKDVAQITIAEVLNVRAGELFPLAETAEWVGKENKVTAARKSTRN